MKIDNNVQVIFFVFSTIMVLHAVPDFSLKLSI